MVYRQGGDDSETIREMRRFVNNTFPAYGIAYFDSADNRTTFEMTGRIA